MRARQLGNQLHIAVDEAHCRAFGLPRIAKQLTFERTEPMRRCEKAIAALSPHNNSRRLRADFA